MTNENTSTITTKWSLGNWLLVFNTSNKKKIQNVFRGIEEITSGKSVIFTPDTELQIHGLIYNRPDFTNGSGVLTSVISRFEFIDGTLYAITKSESCYRLEAKIDGFGVRYGDDITVERMVAGEIQRYQL